MAFTAESMEPVRLGTTLQEPSHFDLPSKEFVGYDPKGHTTITGTPIQKPQEPVAAEAVEAPQEETVVLSTKVSAIARKEQAQRQREQAILRREKELEEKLAAGEKFLKIQEKIKSGDYTAADELEMKYDDYVKHELNKVENNDPAEMRTKKLEEEIANLKEQQEERELEEYERNQNLWKSEIHKLVSENPDFSAIKKMNAEHIVLQHVNDSFEEDGIELTAEQAAKEISDALKERAKKFSAILDEDKPTESKVMGPPKSSVKTITQTMTTTPKTAPASKPFHLMSESEQIQEAIRRVQAAKLQR